MSQELTGKQVTETLTNIIVIFLVFYGACRLAEDTGIIVRNQKGNAEMWFQKEMNEWFRNQGLTL